MTFIDKAWKRAAKFHQVGIVVRDIAAAIAEMEANLGIPPADWERVDVTGEGFEYREPGVAEARTVYGEWARAKSGGTVYQLIAMDPSPSVWSEALASGRPVFAIAHYVDNVDEAMAAMAAAGSEVLAWGRVSEGEARYQYAFVRMAESRLVIELMGEARD